MSTAEVIEAALTDLELDFERHDDGRFVVALPGEKRLKTACWLTVGAHALEIEAFVMRRPDENHERVYEFLLQRNVRMYAVSWAIDGNGDVYLAGRVPLSSVTAEEIDRILGAVLEYADGSFNVMLELGFGSSIKREWEWRVKRGESLANLAAFETFAKRPVEEPVARRPVE
ncbi:YbjN domain-containing protein [Jatrophihabitans sp.]|uniref:YbjN domain-containing protein n=1 Tax=Jatrophihabitans sp. TaxID=1932789 RepID=UPI0030C78441|nr:histidine kinase [Jatrophihabitans sp.]